MSVNTNPAIEAGMIIGSAIVISLNTPDGEVYVDAPVKFIAKKADSAGKSSIYPIPKSRKGDENQPKLHIIRAMQINPKRPPLKENALPGIKGSNIGVRNAPAAIHTA